MEQRTPEWFEARKNRVTASNVGAILGLSPYMTRDDVMRAMVRASLGVEAEFKGNVATQWGANNEETARMDYELVSLRDVENVGFITAPGEDWLGASPDGLLGDDGLLELKCPYGIRDDDPPAFKSYFDAEMEHYYGQVQVQMHCTGRKWTHAFQWTPNGHKLELVPLDRDWLATNLRLLKEFHIEFLEIIADEERSASFLEEKRVVIDTPEAHKMAAEYDELVEQISLAEERKKQLLGEMVTMSGEKMAIFAGRKLTPVNKEGSVSYAKIVKEKLPGLDLEPWRGKPTSYWLFK